MAYFTCLSKEYCAAYYRSSSYSFSSSSSNQSDFGLQKYSQKVTRTESGKLRLTVSNYYTSVSKNRKEGSTLKYSTSQTVIGILAKSTNEGSSTAETKGSACKKTYKSNSTFKATYSSKPPINNVGEEYQTKVENPVCSDSHTRYNNYFSKGTVMSWLTCSGRSTATSSRSIETETTKTDGGGTEKTTIKVIGTSTRTCKTRVYGIGTIQRYTRYTDYYHPNLPTIKGSKAIRYHNMLTIVETNTPEAFLLVDKHETIFQAGTHYLCGRIIFGRKSLYIENPYKGTIRNFSKRTFVDTFSSSIDANSNYEATEFTTSYESNRFGRDTKKTFKTINKFNKTKTRPSTSQATDVRRYASYEDTVVYDDDYGSDRDALNYKIGTNRPVGTIDNQTVMSINDTYSLDIAGTKFTNVTYNKTTSFKSNAFIGSGIISAREKRGSVEKHYFFQREEDIKACAAQNIHAIRGDGSPNSVFGVYIDVYGRHISGVVKEELGIGSTHNAIADLGGLLNIDGIFPYPLFGANMGYNRQHEPYPQAYAPQGYNSNSTQVLFYIGASSTTTTTRDAHGAGTQEISERIGSTNNFFPEYTGSEESFARKYYERTSVSWKLESDSNEVTGSKSYWNFYSNAVDFNKAEFSYNADLSSWDINKTESLHQNSDLDGVRFCESNKITEKLFGKLKGQSIAPLLSGYNRNFIERSNQGIGVINTWNDRNYGVFWDRNLNTGARELEKMIIGGIDAEGKGFTYHLQPFAGQNTTVLLYNEDNTQVVNLASTGVTFSHSNMYIVSEANPLIKSVKFTKEVDIDFNTPIGFYDTVGLIKYGMYGDYDLYGYNYNYYHNYDKHFHCSNSHYMNYDAQAITINQSANTIDKNVEIPLDFLPVGASTTRYYKTSINGREYMYKGTFYITKMGVTGEDESPPEYMIDSSYIYSLNEDCFTATFIM